MGLSISDHVAHCDFSYTSVREVIAPGRLTLEPDS